MSAPQRDDDPHVLRISKVDVSLALILTPAILARLDLAEGDKLLVSELTERGFRVRVSETTHERGMTIARKAMRDHAATFEALAETPHRKCPWL